MKLCLHIFNRYTAIEVFNVIEGNKCRSVTLVMLHDVIRPWRLSAENSTWSAGPSLYLVFIGGIFIWISNIRLKLCAEIEGDGTPPEKFTHRKFNEKENKPRPPYSTDERNSEKKIFLFPVKKKVLIRALHALHYAFFSLPLLSIHDH